MRNRVLGEEAHIKGEKPTSKRYDPAQSSQERDSYLNHILLCRNHHIEIDDDPEKWTVERLHQMKTEHETRVRQNVQHPRVFGGLKRAIKRFDVGEKTLEILVTEMVEPAGALTTLTIDASSEGGYNSGIRVSPGEIITFFARGLISYDGGYHFTTPEGILCNEYGLPLLTDDGDGNDTPVVWPHDQAYKTDGGQSGLIGSLFGWIDHYSEADAFLIGSKREVEVTGEGILFLSVNDAKGTYADNDGEYRVEIRVTKKDRQILPIAEHPYFRSSKGPVGIRLDTSRSVGPTGEAGQEVTITPIESGKGPQGPVEDE